MSSRRSHGVRVCVRATAADPNACSLPGLRLAPCWARTPMPLTAGSAAWWSTGPGFGHEQALISERMYIVIHVCKTKPLGRWAVRVVPRIAALLEESVPECVRVSPTTLRVLTRSHAAQSAAPTRATVRTPETPPESPGGGAAHLNHWSRAVRRWVVGLGGPSSGLLPVGAVSWAVPSRVSDEPPGPKASSSQACCSGVNGGVSSG